MELLGSLPYLMRKKYIIIAAALLGGALMLLYCRFIAKPVYTATSSILIDKHSVNMSSNQSYEDFLTTTNMVKTFTILLGSDTVLDDVSSRLDDGVTTDEIKKAVTISGENGTKIINISVNFDKPSTACAIANEIAKTAESKKLVNDDTITISTIDKAELPKRPTSPDTIKFVILGILVGFIGSFFILIIVNYTDDKIRSKEDIEKICSIRVFGTFPSIECHRPL